MTDNDELSYADVWDRIADLAEELLSSPDQQVVGRVAELLDWIDAFHRDGLGRLAELIRLWRGEVFLDTVAADEITGTLFRAYGLGSGDEVQADAEEAVEAAMATVRPLIESHGGHLEVDSIADGVVKVRMKGTCDGCPSSGATLTYGVEAALREHWPNFRRLELLDPPAEIDPSKADLECVTVPEDARRPAPAPAVEPQPVLLQIRGHEGR